MLDISSLASGLQCDADGIWASKIAARVSYADSDHDACLAVEDTSFWFSHRNRCILAAAKRYLGASPGPLFDVGGGNGYVAAGLSGAGIEVVVVEPGRRGAENARRRGLPNVICATTDTAGFRPGSMPAVGLFDVIEHIEDDVFFLASIERLMTPGGWLLATVPAYQLLWSDEDESAGHQRRYTLRGICTAMQAAGLQVEYASHFFRVLPLPIFLLRALPYRVGWRRRAAPAREGSRHHKLGPAPVARPSAACSLEKWSGSRRVKACRSVGASWWLRAGADRWRSPQTGVRALHA